MSKKSAVAVTAIIVLVTVLWKLGEGETPLVQTNVSISQKKSLGSTKMIPILDLDKRQLVLAPLNKIPSERVEQFSNEPCWSKLFQEHISNCGAGCLERRLPRDSLSGKVLEGGWGENNYPVKKDQETKLGNFYFALMSAGMLSGREGSLDYEESISSFEKLHREDPENAALLYYAAAVKLKLGNKAEAIELIRRAEKLTIFNSYVSEFHYDLFRNASKDPLDFIEATSLWGQFPIPDYIALKNMFMELKNPLKKLGQQLVQPTLAAGGNQIDLKWVLIEYAVGRSMLSKEGIVSLPTLKDLFKKNDYFSHPIYEIEKPGNECTFIDLNAWLTNYRKNFD